MVISAYYSKIPTITCEDCGETVEWQHEHTHVCGQEDDYVPPVPASKFKAKIDDLYRSNSKRAIRPVDNITQGMDRMNVGEKRGMRTRANRPGQISTSPVGDDSDYGSPRMNSGRENSARNDLDRQNSVRSRNNREAQNSPRNGGRRKVEFEPCLRCEQGVHPEEGFEIEALNGWFHEDCFTCDVCQRPFDEEYPFVPHEGKAYCEVHYEEIFLPTCAACQKPITDDKISYAFGRTFHARHLRCHICKHRIRGPHIEHNGKAFCEEDYEKLTNSNCLRCGERIDGPSVAACGGVFHKPCFSCTTCSQPFPDKKFYIFEDLPYCLDHYHEVSNTICGACNEPIQGPCVDVEEVGYRFHPNCWCCAACEQPLTGVYYSFNGMAYCENDIDRVYKQSNNSKKSRPTKRNTLIR